MNDLLATIGGSSSNVYDSNPTTTTTTTTTTKRGAAVVDVERGRVEEYDAYGVGNANDASSGVTSSTSTVENLMKIFFVDVQVIKQNMMMIREALTELNAEHEASKSSTKGEEMAERQERMNRTIERVSNIARETKLRLENLDEDNAKAISSGVVVTGSSEHRTRSALTSSMKTKLKQQMGEFQNLRERLREEYKEIVERRYFAVTGQEANDAEVERLIETGESETMFQTALLEQGRGQILDTVNEIQDRHYAIRELERKLLELNQVFLDMSVLVEAQGEMIDNVEMHVSKSVEFVKQGNVELRKARMYQKSTRKWACCIMIILLVILIAILLPVLKPWSSGSA